MGARARPPKIHDYNKRDLAKGDVGTSTLLVSQKLLFSIVCEECHVLMVQVLKKEEEFSSEALFFCPQCNHGITFHYVG